MKDLIYYPHFESKNLDWIKFALLYIDKLNPIIPPSGEKYLSNLFKKLKDETDLITIHRPEYKEGYLSSLDAIDIVQKIMSAPNRFDLLLGHVDAVKFWQNKENQKYKLFREKYAEVWEQFCLENGFAKIVHGGMLISEQLGTLYMTVLANTIADSRGVSSITDQEKKYNLAYFLKKEAPINTNLLLNANCIIKLKLPSNIQKIDLNSIIYLRNSKNFKKHLKAFHTELENFHKNIEDGQTSEDFVNLYKSALADFNDHIHSLSIDAINFYLGAEILLQHETYSNTEFFKTILFGGAGLIIKSGYSLNKTWRNTKSKRHCRRYLTDLTNLRPIKHQLTFDFNH